MFTSLVDVTLLPTELAGYTNKKFVYMYNKQKSSFKSFFHYQKLQGDVKIKMHCLWRKDMSLSGIGWYAKVNELMIISEDPKV